ncbi:MAG: hypothetical protein L6R19_13005 [Alphaproteobacteria bacterium]|nr:hypothetical protein [Alphaproteobacteria bacterium]
MSAVRLHPRSGAPSCGCRLDVVDKVDLEGRRGETVTLPARGGPTAGAPRLR